MCARVCAPPEPARSLSPPLAPLPACSLPFSPRPALQPSPRNQCSCCRAGCGFLQSLPRPPLRPERARSPAQQRPPVPSCEPRPQPRTAPRSRLPAHPPGRRGAGGGRDPGAPTPLSVGGRWGGLGRKMPTHWGCLPGGLLGGWRAGGGARAQAGKTPLPHRCPAPWERRGGREAAEPGRGWRGEPGSPGLFSTRTMRAGAAGSAVREHGTPVRTGVTQPHPWAQRRRFLLSASTASSLQQGAAAPGAGVGTEWAAGRAYFRVCSLRPGLVGSGGGGDRARLRA